MLVSFLHCFDSGSGVSKENVQLEYGKIKYFCFQTIRNGEWYMRKRGSLIKLGFQVVGEEDIS